MNLTTTKITFLTDVDKSIKVDMSSSWRYRYFPGSLSEISDFIKLIGPDKIYLLIPILGKSNSLHTSELNLSPPFLVNNKSNPVLIINFIVEQWNSSPFEKKKDAKINLSIRFKRVWLE